MFFQANGTNQHDRFRALFDIIVDPEIFNAEFLRRHGIGTHRLSMARFDRRLVGKLFIDGIQDGGLLARRQITQVLHCHG
jgi:hypothetical protein